MAHHESCHVLEEVGFLLCNAISRLIVEHAVCAYTCPTRCLDRCSGIEARFGPIRHVWPVAETLIFEKIIDHVDFVSAI
jgi:hypothetical protein